MTKYVSNRLDDPFIIMVPFKKPSYWVDFKKTEINKYFLFKHVTKLGLMCLQKDAHKHDTWSRDATKLIRRRPREF